VADNRGVNRRINADGALVVVLFVIIIALIILLLPSAIGGNGYFGSPKAQFSLAGVTLVGLVAVVVLVLIARKKR
jgi:membrane protein YdbS with pleckstrin-like domain